MVGSARLVRGRSLRMLVTGRSLLRGRPADPVGSAPPPSRMLVTPPMTLVKGSSVPVGRATPLITVVTPPMMLVRGSSVPVGRATPLMTVVTPPMMLVKGRSVPVGRATLLRGKLRDLPPADEADL